MYLRNFIVAIFVLAAVAYAQNPVTADSPFQVRYVANLSAANQAYITLTNSGFRAGAPLATGLPPQGGNLCANIYAFAPNESFIACTGVLVTPNATVRVNVNGLVGANTSAVIKIVATLTGSGGTSTVCSAHSGITLATVSTGLAAWGTTFHASPAGRFVTVGGAFSPASLTSAEVLTLNGSCGVI
jgi:hypothetical protein